MEADEPIIVGPPVLEVAVTAVQLRQLEQLRAALAENGSAPSIEQVTDMLLTWASKQLSPDAIKKLVADNDKHAN